LTGEVGLRGKLPATQQTPLWDSEPDFDLIEPTAVQGDDASPGLNLISRSGTVRVLYEP